MDLVSHAKIGGMASEAGNSGQAKHNDSEFGPAGPPRTREIRRGSSSSQDKQNPGKTQPS